MPALNYQSPNQLHADYLEVERGWLNNEFLLYVQPKMNLCTQQLEGVECLLRWEKSNALLSPISFISQVRAFPDRQKISRFVVLKSLQIMCQLDRSHFVGQVSINMDAEELTESMIAFISQQIIDYEGNNTLEIELTEHASIFEYPSIIRGLERLRALGVRIALDDFGTGFASYSVLDKFPFDTFKLDKSFIQSESELTEAIIKHVVDVAKITNKQLIIEGVETQNQIERSLLLGASWVQGFEVGKPMPIEQFISLIQTSGKAS